MPDEITVNSHGTNAAIKAHILSDDEMYKIGFRDYYYNDKDNKTDYWFYDRMIPNLGKGIEISFIVHIPKDGSDIEIMTLDDDFGQYYDYQQILEHCPSLECPLKVRDFVEAEMKKLQNAGVLSGHKYGDYI